MQCIKRSTRIPWADEQAVLVVKLEAAGRSFLRYYALVVTLFMPKSSVDKMGADECFAVPN